MTMTSKNENTAGDERKFPYTHYSDLQVLSKSFQAANRHPGTATFTIQVDIDPARHGIPLLNFPSPDKTVGFPLAHATVSSPNSRGYASYYGWVQLVAFSPAKLDYNAAPWQMDLLPALSDLNNPFCWYGSEPTLFDGPFNVEVQELDWIARSFLAYLPDAAMSKVVVPLVGFEWGYWMTGGKAKVKELKGLDIDVWNEHLELFRSRFSEWEFKEV